MAELHGGRRDKLVVSPNLWAGVGLVRGGAGTALVGTPEQIAERIREYQAIGIDTIIGSGYPHLEEAYRVAELLFPRLGLGEGPAEGAAKSIGPKREFSVGFHGASRCGPRRELAARLQEWHRLAAAGRRSSPAGRRCPRGRSSRRLTYCRRQARRSPKPSGG